VDNLINLFKLHIEKIIIVLAMTLVIINGEIDLSVASIMGLSATVMAGLYESGTPLPLAIVIALVVSVLCGINNGFWVAYVGVPSLAVTLAGQIGYRGLAKIFIEDRSVGSFPDWLNQLGQQSLIGPFPLALLIFFVLLFLFALLLHYSAFGRYVYVIGNNREAARYSGVKVPRVKMWLFIISAIVAGLAGILYAARLGAVRASTAEGFELDIVTMVLLGGVSIFGGKGTLTGVGLSVLIVLCLRNGMGLLSITGNTQTMVIGIILILSVLIPNLVQNAQGYWKQRQRDAAALIKS
jgi:rhamnose transport system permease protein